MSGPLIQLTMRRDLAATWTSVNPVLGNGEKGLEIDTTWMKIGDGVTAWTALPYWHGPPWIEAIDGGSPSSTYPGEPTDPFYGIMGSFPYPKAIELQKSPSWYTMEALGRGPATNELIVIGQETSGTLDLGVLNTDTNLFTTVEENTFSGVSLTICDGVDMDRSTGVIVAVQGNSTSNTYPAFWSDDLGQSWTQCTGPATTFQGQIGIWFDENHGIWFWSTGTDTLVSNDGKAFYQQQVALEGYGTFDMATTQCRLHSGFFGDASFGGSTTERLWGFNPPDDTVPIVVAGNAGVWEGYSISTGGLFTNPSSPTWNAGINVFEDEIYLASSGGEIIKSANGARGIGNWSVVAEDNEITDGFNTFNFMQVINGVFWWCRGNGGSGTWYRYGTGGAPVGYGWVQDNTGPFGITTIAGSGGKTQEFSVPGQRFAYIGAEYVDFPVRPSNVYYDVNS